MTLLEGIQAPEDLKNLSLHQLPDLAQEIRARLLQVLSKTGGHLASNLGSIELTIALHYVFNSPLDKFIFDVSHQTYTHKLLTGRNDSRFEKIRKYRGLSGFAHPKESPHDHFFAGHAGTALSLALGMAHSRELKEEEGHILPIMGDATLTCGLTLEALNNIPRDLKKFIVILNDNEMSISKNVGSITHILSRLISNPTTSKWVHELETLIGKIPGCGSSLAKQGVKLTESVKNLVSTAPFFEQFNLSYMGPIDGHDVKKVCAVLQAAKDLPMPVLIHLFTKKGFGVELAEKDPIAYHGVKAFDPQTCQFLPASCQKPTFPKIFGKYMVEMADKDPLLTIITPAMSLGSCLDTFRELYPTRFFDVGIAEGHAVTFAGGLAKSRELKVVCSIYSTFLQRALDNLFHDICLQEIPVVFAVDRAGLATGDGATHHGIYEISFLRAMPHMVICQPRDGHLLKELLESAFSWKLPTAIRYPNCATVEENKSLVYRPLGKAEILAEGSDLLFIALGDMCYRALEIREILLKEGLSATVVDPIFVKPLDKALLAQLLLTHNQVVTLEEHSLKGGLASEINDFLMAHEFNGVQVLNLGIPDLFMEQGSQQELLQEIGLSNEQISRRIMLHFSEKVERSV